MRAGEPRRRAKRSKAMWRGSEEAKKRRRRRLEEATSRAQPRPVCNLPNDLQHSGINNHGRSESYETVRCGGILFKNNCVPSCDGFLCLITANCSEFTSIMARLTRRLCNGRECIRKRERERESGIVLSSRRQLQFLCVLARQVKNPQLVTRIDLLPRFHGDPVPDLRPTSLPLFLPATEQTVVSSLSYLLLSGLVSRNWLVSAVVVDVLDMR